MADRSPGTLLINQAQNNPESILDAGFEQFGPGLNARAKRLVNDSSVDYFDKVVGILDSRLSDATKDYLVQYTLNEQSAKNAYQREMEASNSQYQRAVNDLQKAGINPFLALQSLSGSTPSSNAQSVTGGLFTSRKNQKDQNSKDIGSRIMSVLGIIAAAVIGAML